MVSGVNWFANDKPQGELQCSAKFRYRQKDNEVTIRFIDDTTVFVKCDPAVKAVTCGQEAVFYQGECCLGGGVIDEVFYHGEALASRLEKRLANGR